MPLSLSNEVRTALEADLSRLLTQEPGRTPIQAARQLQLRFAAFWTVLAPLMEDGRVVVAGEGLFLAAHSAPAGPPSLSRHRA